MVAPTPVRSAEAHPATMTLALMVAAEPIRASTWLEVVSPTIEPAASPKTIRPIWKVLAPSASRIAGVRATQLAIADAGQREDHEDGVAPGDDLRAGERRRSRPTGPDAGAGWDTG